MNKDDEMHLIVEYGPSGRRRKPLVSSYKPS